MAETVDTLTLTTEIVSSYLGNATHVNAADIPAIIRSVRQALMEQPTSGEGGDQATELDKPTRAQIRKSITSDALISFVDGKPYKTLKRHLARHGLDMAAYRERFGLPSDYPSVAASFSQARSEMSKAMGLGRRGSSAATPTVEPAPPPESAPPATAPAKAGGRRRKTRE